MQAGERVAFDLLRPLPVTEKGNNYIMVMSNYVARWVEAYPIPNQMYVGVKHQKGYPQTKGGALKV